MPRSVLGALLAAGWLALLEVANLCLRAYALVSPAGSRLSHLHLPPTGIWVYLAGGLLVGARRRDPRVPFQASWTALAFSIMLGVVAAGMLLASAIIREWELAAMGAGALCLIVAPLAAVAYGLSRPSAKAWFAPRP